MRPFTRVGSKKTLALTVIQKEFLARLKSAPLKHKNDQGMKTGNNSPTMPTMAMVPWPKLLR